jgi:hypothetical protein
MAAPLGFKTFATGDVLTAADTNGYLMQGVWTFADATARDAAVTSPQEGNVCYLKSTDAVMTYSGSAWVTVGASMTLLSTTTLSGASTAINSISQSYKDLYVTVEGAYAATSGSTIQIQGNTSNSFQMVGSYNVAGAGSPTNYSQTWNSSLNLPLIAGSAIGGYLTSAWNFTIKNYASSTYPKPVNLTGFWRGSATSDNVINAGGSYNTTAALSTLTFSMSSGNLGGGTVKVYGVN